jgi:DHA3 family macrolide efflux protein-like MFS transporter
MEPKPAERLWNRSFTLLWQGQLISSIGKNAFALTALLWLKQATGSGTLSGLLTGLAMLPMVLLGPVAGVFVDRVNRGRMIAWTDVAGGLLVSAAAALFFLVPGQQALLLAAVFVVSLGTGLLDTFSQPSIMAAIPDLVPREKLEAANSLNMSGLHVAMLVAQGTAGLFYSLVGAPALVAANAVAYLWAGFTELGIKTPDRRRAAQPGRRPLELFLAELAEGARYVWRHRGLRTMLGVFTALNFFVAPLLALMAFFVQDYLRLGPEWLGYLMACYGAGGLIGFLLAGALPARGRGREALVAGATVGQSATIPLMLLLPYAPFQVVGFLAAGVMGGLVNVNVMTLLQTAPPPELRGRVQSLAITIGAGVMPVGMALAGVLFDLSGKNFWLVIGIPGLAMLLVSAAALFSRHYRSFLAYRPRAASAPQAGAGPAGASPTPADPPPPSSSGPAPAS